MRPSDADDVGQARSDGRVTQQEYLDSPCGFCGCRRGDHTSAQALDCYRDIAARQASEDGLPPEVECSVDGCTYRNRPMATMWRTTWRRRTPTSWSGCPPRA